MGILHRHPGPLWAQRGESPPIVIRRSECGYAAEAKDSRSRPSPSRLGGAPSSRYQHAHDGKTQIKSTEARPLGMLCRMRSWGHPPSPDHLALLSQAAVAFRETWVSISPPWPAAFDGTPTDVRAIDYLHYEGIDFPKCGLEGAALICGEVLRRAAGLEWIISYRGDWFLLNSEGSWPGIAICPLARLQELEFSGTPQVGRFALFIARAAFDCFPFAEPGCQPALRELIENGDEFVLNIERTIAQLRRTGQSP
jgi:hypothetical protein